MKLLHPLGTASVQSLMGSDCPGLIITANISGDEARNKLETV